MTAEHAAWLRALSPAGLVFGILALLPFSDSGRARAARDEAQLRRDIEAALRVDPRLAGVGIESVDLGVVVLEGRVGTLPGHLRALEVAESVPGVEHVVSEVRSPDRSADEELWRDSLATYESAATPLRDAWLMGATKLTLLGSGAVGSDIEAHSHAGVVTLFGSVESDRARVRAGDSTARIPGVEGVRNRLQVVPPRERAEVRQRDAEIEPKVRHRLDAFPALARRGLNVDVSDGVRRRADPAASAVSRPHRARRRASRTGVRRMSGAAPRMEPRLLVVSNRLPVSVRTERGRTRVQRSTGGLVAALEPALRRRGGVWLGWAGGALPTSPQSEVGASYRLATLTLSLREVEGYYHGFANRTLWPLLHSFPTRMELDPDDWAVYEEVNRRFAKLAAATAGPDELVWIHDYHLMRVAPALRRLRSGARVAFFLHVPFPPADLFRILPWDRELLRGLLACDLVGFHCTRYASNFLDCVEQLLGARVDRERGQVEHGQHTVSVTACPLGTDYELFAQRARDARDSRRLPERIVLGVDRLDYTKGLPEKILAFERLLELHPEHRERTVLVQIAEPSRGEVAEYRREKRELDELVGRVNGRFGTSRWTPVHYIHRHYEPEALAQLYRDADVALVTPLRDGMNLVAKEYVACQVREPGVLVLSELAGAAESMHEALRVNPYHRDAVAESLHQALVMDPVERTARMRALQRRERRGDVHAWLDTLLTAALAPPARFPPVRPEDFARWLERLLAGTRVALFVDYDGTLAPITRHPGQSRMSDSMREALTACVAREDTEVGIVSGRALAELRAHVALPGVAYAANHGLEIEGPGLDRFAHPDLSHFVERSREVARALREVSDPGVWLEEKGASLTLHYREAPPDTHAAIAERAREIVTAAGFQARDALCAVEGRPPTGWDKGRAVFHMLRARHGPEWPEHLGVVYVGDDETDEDAFRALEGLAFTFRVGPAERPTSASRRLPDVDAVEALLRFVAARPARGAGA